MSKRQNYELIDGERMNREHPETFEIPSLIERRNLPVGALVKAIFQVPGTKNGERMWMVVSEAGPDGYVGL